MSLYLCIVGIFMYARKQKTFALIAVHPAYACEATTAKKPARSQVAELEPWKSRSLQVQRHRRGQCTRRSGTKANQKVQIYTHSQWIVHSTAGNT